MATILDSINLFVKDMNQTLKFYSLLGFSFQKDDYSKNYIKISFGTTSLCFYTEKITKEFFNKESIHSGTNYKYELSFRVDSPQEVDEVYEKIIAQGNPSIKKPLNADWNQRVAFVTDPDNNLIEICAFLEKSV